MRAVRLRYSLSERSKSWPLFLRSRVSSFTRERIRIEHHIVPLNSPVVTVLFLDSTVVATCDDYSTIRETEATTWIAGTRKVRDRLTVFFAPLSISQRPHFSDSSAISSNVMVRSSSRSERAATEHSYRTELHSLFRETLLVFIDR
jgi:hypothetical protein